MSTQKNHWVVAGNLGLVEFGAHRLGGERNINLWLDLTDLIKFIFWGIKTQGLQQHEKKI